MLDRRRSEGVAPYVIYYGLRTPPHGRCSLGWDGVDDEALIDMYAMALRAPMTLFAIGAGSSPASTRP